MTRQPDDLLARLKRVAMDENENLRYPTLTGPVGYTHDGISYALATDGHLAVLVRYDGDLPPMPIDITPIMAHYRPSDLRVDAAALAAFSGEAEYFFRHEECDECQGHWPSARPGLVGSTTCDLNLLARGLEFVTDPEAELALPTEDQRPIFLRWSSGWVVLMPMRPDDRDDLPKFEVNI